MQMDVTEATFEQDVIERSRSVPVVVDFWAAWCGPCRQLTPVLEKAVEKHGDEMVLAKLDTDANPVVAARYDIRGIPAVKAFRDGRVVDEFTGAVPPATVEAFLARLLPSEATRPRRGRRRGLAAARDRARARARRRPRRARQDPARARRVGGGHRAAAARSSTTPLPPACSRAQSWRPTPLPRPASRPHSRRSTGGDFEAALEGLLAAVTEAQGETRDRVRRVMVGIFAQLGTDHPLSVSYRRQLARALY